MLVVTVLQMEVRAWPGRDWEPCAREGAVPSVDDDEGPAERANKVNSMAERRASIEAVDARKHWSWQSWCSVWEGYGFPGLLVFTCS